MPDPIFTDYLTPPAVAPLLQWRPWFAALNVAALAGLAGAVPLVILRLRMNWGERWLMRFALGLAILPAIVLIVGQVPGLLFHAPLGAALPCVVGWMIYSKLIERKNGIGEIESNQPEQYATNDNRIGRIVGLTGWLVLGFWWLMLLLPAFSPPINYDVLEYHLGIIPEIFRAGRVQPVPGVFYSAQPLATEMLYLLGAVGENRAWGYAPGLVQWLIFVFGAVLWRAVARSVRIAPMLVPWLWLLWMAHPLVFKLQLDNLTDGMGGFFMLAGIWVALRGRDAETAPLKTAVLIGVFAGAAVTTKWTNGGTVTLPLLMLAGLTQLDAASPDQPVPLRQRGSGVMRFMFIAGAAAFFLWLPWGLWLQAVRGNPFHPFMATIFPSPVWTPDQQAFLIGQHGPLSMLEIEYWENLFSRIAVKLPGLPLVALALVAGMHGLLITESRQAARRNLGLSLPCFLIFALALGPLLWGQLEHAADRFLIPTYLAALIMIGWFSTIPPASGRTAHGILTTIVILLAVYTMPGNLAMIRAMEFQQHAMGRRSWMQQWAENLGGVNAAMIKAANELPEGSRVLTVNEARRYFFLGEARVTSVFDRQPLMDHLPQATRSGRGPKALRESLRTAGYTHLLVNDFEALRILHTHPGDRLVPYLHDWRERPLGEFMNTPGLLAQYGEQAEFPHEALPKDQLQLYRNFLEILRRQAVWSTSPNPVERPTMWIAPL